MEQTTTLQCVCSCASVSYHQCSSLIFISSHHREVNCLNGAASKLFSDVFSPTLSFSVLLTQTSLLCLCLLSCRVCICGYPRQQMRRYKGISTRLTVTSEFLVQLITGIHYAL